MKGDPVCDLLRLHGLRRTSGRERILRLLKRARRPLSHADVLRRLKGAGPDRVSVYRALEAFVDAGLVHRAYVGGRAWMYETADHCTEQKCHPHFTCRICGAVRCMTEAETPMAKGLPNGFVSERQKVHIEGVCAACRNRKTPPT